MKDLLYRCDGEPAPGLLLYLVCHFSCYIDCGEGGIVSERQPVCVCGLPALEPGVLLRVAEQELNLKAGVIDQEHFGHFHRQVCAEYNLPVSFVSALELDHNDLDPALEGLALDNGAEYGHDLAIHRHALSCKHTLAQRGYVRLPVNLLLPVIFLGSVVEILQHRIIPATAHHIETKAGRPLDKAVACEEAVAYKNPGDSKKLLAMVKYGSEALCRLVVAFVLHMLKIERSPSPCLLIKCLGCEKESCIAHPGCDLGKAEYLKTALGRACTARPAMPYAWCLLAGHLHIAMVMGYGCSAGRNGHAQDRVECGPVELLLEVLPEAALAGFAGESQRQEIEFRHLSRYNGDFYV